MLRRSRSLYLRGPISVQRMMLPNARAASPGSCFGALCLKLLLLADGFCTSEDDSLLKMMKKMGLRGVRDTYNPQLLESLTDIKSR